METKTAQKTLEEKVTTPEIPDVKFSWRAVIRRWGENLKSDVDPALTGAKAGYFFFHGIPTWARHYDEGKMSTSKRGLATLAGLLVGGSIGTGYYVGAQAINVATGGVLGYAIVGVPLVANGTSWVYEAYYKAKKSECEKVVMTKIQRSFETTKEEYALSNKQLLEQVTAGVYQEYKGQNGMTKERATDAAKTAIIAVASDVFNGLVADGNLGKKYEMSETLFVGPKKRKRDKQESYACHAGNSSNIVAEVIADAVEKNGGTANIELFGTVTTVYSNGKDKSYEIMPNKSVWKV